MGAIGEGVWAGCAGVTGCGGVIGSTGGNGLTPSFEATTRTDPRNTQDTNPIQEAFMPPIKRRMRPHVERG